MVSVFHRSIAVEHVVHCVWQMRCAVSGERYASGKGMSLVRWWSAKRWSGRGDTTADELVLMTDKWAAKFEASVGGAGDRKAAALECLGKRVFEEVEGRLRSMRSAAGGSWGIR